MIEESTLGGTLPVQWIYRIDEGEEEFMGKGLNGLKLSATVRKH